jgi:hypothetical protein
MHPFWNGISCRVAVFDVTDCRDPASNARMLALLPRDLSQETNQ